MSERGLVLVTGSAGRIGQAVVRELQARRCPVRGLDRMPTPGLPDACLGDISDPQILHQAVHGVETVIHLAATPDDDDFLTQLLPNNILGVYHLLEACRQARVCRLILGSSGQVVWGQRESGPWPVGVQDLPTPRYWYAVTKVFLEAAGYAYSSYHGLQVLVVRLGWCPRSRTHAQELAATSWGPDVYLSPADAGRFFAHAVAASWNRNYAIVYVTSRPRRQRIYDLEPARQLFGYEPRDQWPEGLEWPLEFNGERPDAGAGLPEQR